MQIAQKEISLDPKVRGFHLITNEIIKKIPEIKKYKQALITLFLKHTSASLSLNENCDPTVRDDLENYINDVVPNKDYFIHTYEGEDDMLSLINGESQDSYKSLYIGLCNYII